MDLKEQYKKIFQYCYYRIPDSRTAEDLTQETFLRFLEHPEYQEKGCDLQYLYTIARNLCIDEYRRTSPEELPEELPDGSDLETELTDSLTLRSIMDALPEEEREIVMLRYINKVSVADISKLYHISWFAMNRRIKKILAKMRHEFEKEGLGCAENSNGH